MLEEYAGRKLISDLDKVQEKGFEFIYTDESRTEGEGLLKLSSLSMIEKDWHIDWLIVFSSDCERNLSFVNSTAYIYYDKRSPYDVAVNPEDHLNEEILRKAESLFDKITE